MYPSLELTYASCFFGFITMLSGNRLPFNEIVAMTVSRGFAPAFVETKLPMAMLAATDIMKQRIALGPPVRNSPPPTQVVRSHCRRCLGTMAGSTLSIDSRDLVEDTLAGLGESVRSILVPLWSGVHYVECSHPACGHFPA